MLVAVVVAEHGVGGDVQDSGAGNAVVSGVEAEVFAHLIASPGERTAAGAAHEVVARDVPSVADEGDDLAC